MFDLVSKPDVGTSVDIHSDEDGPINKNPGKEFKSYLIMN